MIDAQAKEIGRVASLQAGSAEELPLQPVQPVQPVHPISRGLNMFESFSILFDLVRPKRVIQNSSKKQLLDVSEG